MKDHDQIEAVEILARLFDVILSEAKARPAFAEKLIRALPESAVARIDKPERAAAKKPGFDPNAFSLVAVYEREGEKGLRQRLNPIGQKKPLLAIAEAQHIPLDEAWAGKKSTKVTAIRAALIDGVKKRIADRLAAAS